MSTNSTSFVFKPGTEDEKAINNVGEVYVVQIGSGIKNREELFDILQKTFQFPYFGRNWDALWDLLGDLHWIQQQKVVIDHAALPNLNDEDLKNYIKILQDAVNDWKPGEKHEIEVQFPVSSKPRIEELMSV